MVPDIISVLFFSLLVSGDMRRLCIGKINFAKSFNIQISSICTCTESDTLIPTSCVIFTIIQKRCRKTFSTILSICYYYQIAATKRFQICEKPIQSFNCLKDDSTPPCELGNGDWFYVKDWEYKYISPCDRILRHGVPYISTDFYTYPRYSR